MLKNLFNKNQPEETGVEEEKEPVEEAEQVEEENEEPAKPSFILKILDVIAPVYRLFDVDYGQLRFIVDTKMKMDGRLENPMDNVWNSGKNKKKERNSFFSTLWVYALISFFMVTIFLYDNYVFQFVTYFSYLFVMMLAILIAHFSNVLLDPKDQEQIGTKPVSAKTLGAAKATHIGIYLVAFSLALGGPMIVFSSIYDGILIGLLTLLLTLLAAVWCLFVTILIYAFVLRHFNGEKLKNMISYSQIGVSVFMIMGYHILGDIFRVVDPETLTLEMNMQWWHIVLFPLWFVAPYGVIEDGFSGEFAIYLGLLVAGTVGLIFLYRAYSDKIDRNLQKMNTDGKKGEKASKLSRFYAKLLCTEQERPYFDFTWQITKNEREFKTRLYPSLASSLLFPIIMMWTFISRGDMDIMQESGLLGYAPYFVTMMVPMTSMTIRYSNNFKARWIFNLRPAQDDGALLLGVFKAMYMKLILPVYGATSLIIIAFTGLSEIPVLVNGLLIVGLVFFFDLLVTLKNIPFTQRYDASEANRGCLATLVFFIATILAVGILIAVQLLVPYGEYGLLVLLAVATLWVFKKGFKKQKFEPIPN